MEVILENIGLGLELLLTPQALFYLVLGVVGGFVVGVLPGFGGASAAALLLPFSISLPTEVALILMVAVYAGAQFAGAVPAILINVPGDAGTAATSLDGYPMAQRGEAGLAIGIARMASVLGGVIAATIVLIVITPLSTIALNFGSREMFAVALFGLTIIGSVVGKDFRKGMISALLGLLLAAMSTSPQTPRPRFTMGFLELYEGVPFVAAVVGVFAITEMLLLAKRKSLLTPEAAAALVEESGGSFRQQLREVIEGIRTTLRYPVEVLSSTGIGLFLGVIPGIGTAVANFISYGEAKRRDKKGEFGTGSPKGIIASEACDNAVAAGTMVPTMTLGIPGSATAAVMLTALYLHGVQPGPRVMVTHRGEVYAVLLGILVASFLILPLGVLLATPLVRICQVPPAVLAPAVIALAVVGAYAVRTSMFDAMVAFVFGILGYFMKTRGYPIVPLILGLILGPIAEANFARSLELGRGSVTYFFGSTTAVVMWSLLVLTVLLRARQAVKARMAQPAAAPSSADVGSPPRT